MNKLLLGFIYEKLEEAGLKGLTAIRIDETCTSICVYSQTGIAGWLNAGKSWNLHHSRQAEDGVGMNLTTIM